ncbi:MAG: HAD family hydrolase [Phycisphaerales bacterium]
MNAAVFLDRDNTLIHNDGDLGDPAEVRLIQGVASAVASLCGLGYKIVVVTNQGGVARGKYTEEDVQAVNQRISDLLAAGANGAKIDRYYYCPYHPDGSVSRYRKEHPNRKPAPGMLLEAARDMGLDLAQSWTIGDQVRDIQAGLAAGTRAILLRQDADRLKPFDPRQHPGLTDQSGGEKDKATPDFYARNLVEAVRIVAQQRKPESSEQIHRSGPPQRKWDAAAVAKLQRERQAAREEQAAAESTAERTATATQVKAALAARSEPKPFRPWNVPVADIDESDDTDQDAQATAQPEPVATPAPAPAREPAPAPAPVAPREPQTSAADDKTLRLILQELRSQRGIGEEFSYTRIMAIVLQTVAGACLLGAFWLGSADAVVFLRLIGSAILAQLAVITALLWDRR